MSNIVHIKVSPITVGMDQIESVMHCFISTIVFQRALEKQLPKVYDSVELPALTYPICSNAALEKKIQDGINAFVAEMKQRMDSKSQDRDAIHAFHLKFYSLKKQKSMFQTTQEKISWEVWTIQLELVEEYDAEKLVGEVKKRMKFILQNAQEKTDHLPSIGQESEKDTQCYPFEFALQGDNNKNWLSNFAKKTFGWF